MEGLTEGRFVHFVLPNGEHRPALVVRVWNKDTGYINLQVFTDGSNDLPAYESHDYDGLGIREAVRSGIVWQTSIYPDEADKKPHTWHWIERA